MVFFEYIKKKEIQSHGLYLFLFFLIINFMLLSFQLG